MFSAAPMAHNGDVRSALRQRPAVGRPARRRQADGANEHIEGCSSTDFVRQNPFDRIRRNRRSESDDPRHDVRTSHERSANPPSGKHHTPPHRPTRPPDAATFATSAEGSAPRMSEHRFADKRSCRLPVRVRTQTGRQFEEIFPACRQTGISLLSAVICRTPN